MGLFPKGFADQMEGPEAGGHGVPPLAKGGTSQPRIQRDFTAGNPAAPFG
jgi:hypothetical protein